MKGLAPHTRQIFEAVSKLDCIKPYLLVGGTALSLQIGTRQSEDLGFMKWRTSKTEKMEVAWYQIEKELATVGEIQHKDILDIDHVEYVVAGVKFSFYACPKCIIWALKRNEELSIEEDERPTKTKEVKVPDIYLVNKNIFSFFIIGNQLLLCAQKEKDKQYWFYDLGTKEIRKLN